MGHTASSMPSFQTGPSAYNPDGTIPILPFTHYRHSDTKSAYDAFGAALAEDAARFNRTYEEGNLASLSESDLYLQVACLKANISRQNAEIRVSTLIRDELVNQLFQLEFELELRTNRRANDDLAITFNRVSSSPQKKTPKETKERKTKSSKEEGPSSKAPPPVAESSSKSKVKLPKTKTRTAQEPGELKEKPKTQPAPATEGSKGKGKQRAMPKSKEFIEEEEEEQVSFGDEDVEMGEAGTAPTAEGSSPAPEAEEEEEDSD